MGLEREKSRVGHNDGASQEGYACQGWRRRSASRVTMVGHGARRIWVSEAKKGGGAVGRRDDDS